MYNTAYTALMYKNAVFKESDPNVWLDFIGLSE